MDVRSSFQSRKKALVLSLLGTAVRHTQWLPSEPPWGRAGGPWGRWWVGPPEPEQVGRRAVRMLCEDVSGLFRPPVLHRPKVELPSWPHPAEWLRDLTN